MRSRLQLDTLNGRVRMCIVSKKEMTFLKKVLLYKHFSLLFF